MRTLFLYFRLLTLLAMTLILSACGGGGSSDKDTTIHTVSATSGTGGSISPASSAVSHGGTAMFTVTPDTGYSIATVSGCDGSLDGSTYTTGAITGACTVEASFLLNTYTVSATTGIGGSISPPNQTVEHGATATFTVAPETGYSIAQVTGCGGTLQESTYITGVITNACTVNASFTQESGDPDDPIEARAARLDITDAEALVITEADVIGPMASHLTPSSNGTPVSLYKIDAAGNYDAVNLLDGDGVVVPWRFIPEDVYMLPGARRGLLRFKSENELFWIFELETGEIYQIEGLQPVDSLVFFDDQQNAYLRVYDESNNTRLARFDLQDPGMSALITPPQHSIDQFIVSNVGTVYYSSFFPERRERILTKDGEFLWLTDLMEEGLSDSLPTFDANWATTGQAWLLNGEIVFLYSYEPLDYVGSKLALVRLVENEGTPEASLLKDLYELHDFYSFEPISLIYWTWLSAVRSGRLAVTLGYQTKRVVDGGSLIGPVAYIHVEVDPNWEVTARGDENETTLVGSCDISDYIPSFPSDIGEDLLANLVAEHCESGSRYIFEWNLITGVPKRIYSIEDAGVILHALVRTRSGNVVFEGYRELDGARYIGQLTKVGDVYEASIVMDAFVEEPIKITRVN
jgi:hypothetical protein